MDIFRKSVFGISAYWVWDFILPCYAQSAVGKHYSAACFTAAQLVMNAFSSQSQVK